MSSSIFFLFCLFIIIIICDESLCATKGTKSTKSTKDAKGAKKAKKGEEPELKPESYFRSIKKNELGIHVIGVFGLDEKTNKIVEGGIEKETEMIFEHIKNLLDKHNTTFKRVATFKFTAKDKSYLPTTEEIMKKYVPPPLPGRSFIESSNLPPGALIECEFFAITAQKLDRTMIMKNR